MYSSIRFIVGVDDSAAFKKAAAERKEREREGVTSLPWNRMVHKYGRRFIATAGVWFLWDVIWYANGLFSSTIISQLTDSSEVLKIAGYQLILAGAALPGYFAAAFLIDYPWLGRRRLILFGLIVIGVLQAAIGGAYGFLKNHMALFIVMVSNESHILCTSVCTHLHSNSIVQFPPGSSHPHATVALLSLLSTCVLRSSSASADLAIPFNLMLKPALLSFLFFSCSRDHSSLPPQYSITFFFYQFGPNAVTFVLPAEVFPTVIRARAHGIRLVYRFL